MQTVTLLRATKSVSKSLRVPPVTRCFPTRCRILHARRPIRGAICLPGGYAGRPLSLRHCRRYNLHSPSFFPLMSVSNFSITVRQISSGCRGKSRNRFPSIEHPNCLSYAKICTCFEIEINVRKSLFLRIFCLRNIFSRFQIHTFLIAKK